MTCNVLGSRIARHADVNQSSSRVPKNDQVVEQVLSSAGWARRPAAQFDEAMRAEAMKTKFLITRHRTARPGTDCKTSRLMICLGS